MTDFNEIKKRWVIRGLNGYAHAVVLFLIIFAGVLISKIFVKFFIDTSVATGNSLTSFIDVIPLTFTVFILAFFLLYRPLMRYTSRLLEITEYSMKVFDEAQVGIWIIDINPLKESEENSVGYWHKKVGAEITVKEVNKRLCEITGRNREEIVGKSIFDPAFVDNENAEIYVKEMIARIEGKSGSYEINLRHSNEYSVPVLINAIPMKKDSDTGKTKQVLGIVTDISESKKMSEIMQDINVRLQSLLKVSPLAVVIIDAEGNVMLWNPAAERIFGWAEQEVLGSPLPIIPDEKKGEFEKIREMTTRGESVVSMETQRLRKDGSLVHVNISTAPLYNSKGKYIGAMGILEDITRQKVAEEEHIRLQKLESLGILAGGIAHDFNNLLASILGNVDMVRIMLRHDKKINSLLKEVEDAYDKAKELSNRLLTFSKGGEPLRETMPVLALLKDTANTILKDSGIDNELIIQNDIWQVEIDAGQIRQVFKNMIMNAKEAMPEGGRLRITGSNIKITDTDNLPLKAGEYVRLSIEDTGKGIPEDILPKIFDPYFTTKEMDSRKGTGLGLAVCYSIVRRHGGHITVKSTPGKGTVFNIYLPAVRNLNISVNPTCEKTGIDTLKL